MTRSVCVLFVFRLALFVCSTFLAASDLYAQSLTPALRRVVANVDGTGTRTFTSAKEYCMARMSASNPTWQALCPADPAASTTLARTAGTEGPAPTYSWYYGGCQTKSGTTYSGCGTLMSTTPARYCADGSAPVNGPVSGEKYCSSSEPPPPPPPACSGAPSGGVLEFKRGDASGNTKGVFPDAIVTGVCVGGCHGVVKDVVSCQKYAGSLQSYCTYRYEQDGTECAGTETAPAAGPGEVAPSRTDVPPSTPPKGASCPAGTVQAGVDSAGTPICMGTGSAPKNAPPPAPKTEISKTEATADGGTKTTDTTVTKNADGSTTTETKTTTTAADGTKTVTVTKDTSAALDGGAGKDDSRREDDKYDLCKQNPQLTICRNSSVSGSCGETSCEGDAIQCATLRAAAKMQCAQEKAMQEAEGSAAGQLGKQILAGNDPATGLPAPGNAAVIDVPALDASGWLGGGSPFKDLTVQVMGNDVTIPLEKWTGYLVALRYALMMVAALVSFRQLSSAVMGV